MNFRRTTFFSLAIVFGAAGCSAPKKEARTPAAAVYAKDMPSQESWNVTLVVSDNGRTKTIVSARHAAEYRQGEKQEIRLDGGINVQLINRDGSVTLITAGRGIVHDNQDIEAFDNVVIRSADNTVIRTEHISRSSSNRMIRSDKYVTISGPSRTIRGYGFESDDAMKRYRIFHASGEALSK
ncbi:LPS export ABC transporter periplasmic protein LptC [Chlorobaculum tepidum]|nr:LPS export ABC transporter periplasmic protein LptC [Chlorobaculum tepidum]